MSAFHDSALIGASGSQGSYQISRSVRLRRSASGYFNRTPASTGNRKTWTWSGWVKRGEFSATSGIQVLFDSRSGASDNTIFGLSFGDGTYGTSADGLFVGQYNYFALVTTQVFRDPSAWYHIVLALDTTQATAANRMKLYVNGLQITTFNSTTYPALNADLAINLNQLHTLGSQSGSSNFTNGYLTDVNFIDGQGLTPSSFGEFNALTGVWTAKKYSGSYGTNGFSVNFSDNSAATAAAIGKDSSGNGNNWTPNNISVTAGVTYDSMIDTPTPYADGGNGRGNYCVLNPLITPATTTIVNGNLGLSGYTAFSSATGTIGVSSGKWYFEFVAQLNSMSGITGTPLGSNYPGQAANAYAWDSFGPNKYNNNTATSYGSATSAGDIVGVAFDLDSGSITFYKNNVSQGTAYTFTPSGTYFPVVRNGSATDTSANFGQRPFTYTPPTGFKALNTQNLPASTIDNGAAHMAATLYTGNGATQSINNTVNSVSFEPGLVWLKARSTLKSHGLFNTVAGIYKGLASNATDAEYTDSSTLTAFNSNGFSLGNNTTFNQSAVTQVAWQWKAGGAAVTNTAGSISSQVSANVSAGFSVVTYTGTGANATVGHGLGAAAKMVIVKRRDVATNWRTWHASLTLGNTLYLDATNAQTSEPTAWNSTAPTSTVFSVGASGGTNTGTMLAYCFAEVAGYSKAFSFTGNGSTDGVFSYLGFKPRMILLKRTDTTGNWYIWDTSRNTYNVFGEELYPNLSNAAASATDLDLLSNGFKLRNSTAGFNANGGTYVGFAWAENPFKNALAR
jgi:hypothetical protein